jgi:hypothetical protein
LQYYTSYAFLGGMPFSALTICSSSLVLVTMGRPLALEIYYSLSLVYSDVLSDCVDYCLVDLDIVN